MTSRLDDEALAGQPLAQGGVGGDEAGAQRLLGRLEHSHLGPDHSHAPAADHDSRGDGRVDAQSSG